MPKNLVDSVLEKLNIYDLDYISYKQIIYMQKHFNVSFSAILTRLIQLYPQNMEELRKRYSLSSAKRSGELLDKTIEFKGNIDLIKPTKDVYVSQMFFEDINSNYQTGKISEDKVKYLVNLLKIIGINE